MVTSSSISENPDLDGAPLGEERKAVLQLFANLTTTASWGSGYNVETLAKRVTGHVVKACASNGTKPGGLAISSRNLVPIMKHMLGERQKRGSAPWADR
ncbi:MAG: hypothetical protein M1813_009198 [Trichoglossum hirsutum]|nr:MAG: hypothetical protein M1813_009198 [Trichoglossum hirsutum]